LNGIDLANSCGLPVAASAHGKVLIARTSGWNGGYGKYVVLAHSNGTQTLYAHLASIVVTPGQEIPRGVPIGSIGSTGNSTGCHVHFEIRGAKNPF
jgi:murein DD-endopeptidase MepM/ murein hydrolase activator NlpD